jgi:hypothetical protein
MSRCIHCGAPIFSDDPVEGQPCLDCIFDGPPKERIMPETPIEEALRIANADKASVLKRIDTEIENAKALPDTGQINNLLRAGRLGALYTLKETFIAAGWIDPREPGRHHPHLVAQSGSLEGGAYLGPGIKPA